MSDEDLTIIRAARVPETLLPQSFGLWCIERHDLTPTATGPNRIRDRLRCGFDSQTVLRRWSWRSLHLTEGEIVMEDSMDELRKHLPIFRRAAGRVLVTGLGLGCVVRGLLSKPSVTHIDVVELDRDIIRVVGPEFEGNPRVTLHHGCALAIELPGGDWDYAWHDLWTDGDEHLQVLHARLFLKFQFRCGWQGAWLFPGNLARMAPWNTPPVGVDAVA